MSKLDIDDINKLKRTAFIETFGFLFEYSPWIIAQAETKRPFASLKAMHKALMDVVAYAGPEAQLALLRAHPKLADKAQIKAGLTRESASEQASAGLDTLSADEFKSFHDLNTAYETRFGFPFIICVRLAGGKSGILKAMSERLTRAPEDELPTALAEVGDIVRLRLMDLTGGTI
jgi:2-oxo-4-hydroxy-4-carboxy-5-ureidoimidazoline decarboxylase